MRWAGCSRRSKIGYPQREIAEAAFNYQRQLEQGVKTVVGVNKYSIPEEIPIEVLKIDRDIEERQIQRLRKMKRERNGVAVKEAIARVAEACRSGENVMEPICDAVRCDVTVGEISDVFPHASSESIKTQAGFSRWQTKTSNSGGETRARRS